MIMAVAFLILGGCHQQESSPPFELTEVEKEAYANFQTDLDDRHLAGLHPVSIAKIYAYAEFEGKHQVSYALYTQRSGYVLWTKEEDASIPEAWTKTEYGKWLLCRSNETAGWRTGMKLCACLRWQPGCRRPGRFSNRMRIPAISDMMGEKEDAIQFHRRSKGRKFS